MDQLTFEVFSLGLRTLFLLGVPVVVVLALAGSLVAAFQAATTVHDSATGYAARLTALVALLYFLYQPFVRSVTALAELAWRGAG